MLTSPADGRYQALVRQDGASGVRFWTVSLNLLRQGATISYLREDGTLACSGTVAEVSNRWIERITAGSCDEGGFWTLTAVTASSFHGSYTPPAGKQYTVEGDFVRVS